MSPEAITAVGVVVAAFVTTGPAYLAHRRARGAARAAQAAQAEGEATRTAVNNSIENVVTRLAERLDVTRVDIRDDISELRTELQQVRDWQTSHAAEHILLRDHRTDT